MGVRIIPPLGGGGGGGGGTVTSVNASGPAGVFSWSGGPVIAAGTLAAALASQASDTFLGAPNGGGVPTFRTLTATDLASVVVWVHETPAGTIDGVNTVFTISNTPTTEVALFLGPSRAVPGVHYNRVTTTITYVAGFQPRVGEEHDVYYGRL